MKASSRRTSNKGKQLRIIALGALGIFVLLTAPWMAHQLAALVVTPVVKTVHWFETSTASLPQYLRNRGELLQEITDLQNEISTMRADRYAVNRLEQENKELRQLLNDVGDNRVVAGVIGRPPELPYDVLLLDRGSDAGLVAGAPVYMGNQTVIGVVRSVTPTTAIVDLVTSPSFESLVYIMGVNIYANAVGTGSGYMVVGVPQGVPVAVDDMVIMPSVSPGVYGTITHIEAEPTRAQQLAYVTTDTTLNSLRLVTVATEPIAVPSVENIKGTVDSALQTQLNFEIDRLPNATTTATSTASTTVPDVTE